MVSLSIYTFGKESQVVTLWGWNWGSVFCSLCQPVTQYMVHWLQFWPYMRIEAFESWKKLPTQMKQMTLLNLMFMFIVDVNVDVNVQVNVEDWSHSWNRFKNWSLFHWQWRQFYSSKVVNFEVCCNPTVTWFCIALNYTCPHFAPADVLKERHNKQFHDFPPWSFKESFYRIFKIAYTVHVHFFPSLFTVFHASSVICQLWNIRTRQQNLKGWKKTQMVRRREPITHLWLVRQNQTTMSDPVSNCGDLPEWCQDSRLRCRLSKNLAQNY